jgi:uncharacterized protein
MINSMYNPVQDESQFGGPVWAVFSDTEGNHAGVYSYAAQS